MTLDDLADYGRVASRRDDELSRLRRLDAAAAGADVGDRRDAEHSRSLRAAVGAGTDAGERSVRRARSTGTWSSKPRSSRIADLYGYNGDPDFVTVPLDQAAVEAVRAIALRPSRIRITRRRRDGQVPAAPATRSCCRRRIAGATWWPGSTATGRIRLGHHGARLRLHCCTIAARLFTLDPKSPNVIAPHKRPFNTLSAGFVMQDDRPLMTVTLMGGDMQAQGHRAGAGQHLDLGANLQAATDMARFHHNQVAERARPRVAALRSRRRAAAGDGSQGRDVERRHRRRLSRPSCSPPILMRRGAWRSRKCLQHPGSGFQSQLSPAADQRLLSCRIGSPQGWRSIRLLIPPSGPFIGRAAMEPPAQRSAGGFFLLLTKGGAEECSNLG